MARALAEKKDNAALVEEIYLATLSRRPTPAEIGIATRHIDQVGDRAKGLQDLQFALLNSAEFLLRHGRAADARTELDAAFNSPKEWVAALELPREAARRIVLHGNDEVGATMRCPVRRS